MTGWNGDRGSRHERGYDSRWVKRRAGVLTRDKHLCQQCRRKGRATPASEVDHIIPKHLDGVDDYDNLEAICTPCHKVKTATEARGARGIKQRPQYDERGFPVWE